MFVACLPADAIAEHLRPHRWLALLCVLVSVLLGACSTPGGPAGTTAADEGKSARSRPGAVPSESIADRPINLNAACEQTDEAGFREQASLRVQDNVVQAMSWQLWVGQRGSCRFDQAGFRQTRRAPHIELQALDGSGCKLLVWQEPRRITLAHTGCEQRCTPGIYEQAWPVMFDPRSGRCAKL